MEHEGHGDRGGNTGGREEGAAHGAAPPEDGRVSNSDKQIGGESIGRLVVVIARRPRRLSFVLALLCFYFVCSRCFAREWWISTSHGMYFCPNAADLWLDLRRLR